MNYDRACELWERKYLSGGDGSPSSEDEIGAGISRTAFPIKDFPGEYIIYNQGVLVVIGVSNDLAGFSDRGKEYRSLVRVEVSPRVGVPKKLVGLLDRYGFKRIC